VLADKIKQKYCSHSCATTNVSQRRPKFVDRLHVKKAERLPDPNQQQVDAAVQQFLAKGGRIKMLDPQGKIALLDSEETEELDALKANKERKNNLKAP
jgi:hypothetical protein